MLALFTTTTAVYLHNPLFSRALSMVERIEDMEGAEVGQATAAN